MEMRQVFSNALAEFMRNDERVVVIDADLAKANGTINLRKEFPDRALEVGVAEANMASVAGGLSSYGFIPFITTFCPFATRRICDQIMISIAYAQQNVKIVGTDPGITAQLNGGTHMSFEDMGVVRSIPEMVIFEPVDAVQLAKAMPQIVAHEGPMYIRLFRKEAPQVFDESYEFDLFKADVIREGKDVTLVATGIMVEHALEAAEELKAKGIEAEVINVHTIKPLDEETILHSVKKTNAIVTCENHNVIGGLKSAVAETLIEKYPVRLKSVGINDEFGEVGGLNELKERYQLTTAAIVAKAMDVYNEK